jgi:diguanylate cyclase (GGDEF)-like protein
VVVAVCAGERDVAEALAAEATDVMRTPVHWELLSRRLSSLLQAAETTAELRQYRSELEYSRRMAADACAQLEERRGVDRLTGLPNREVLEELMARSLARSRGPGSAVALMLLDLDRFSEINETLGRRSGDEALRQVAERLSAFLRSSDLEPRLRPGLLLRAAARLSGDEFALLLTSLADPAVLSHFAEGVLDTLSQPIRVDGTDVFLSASIGISISAAGAGQGEVLFQQAETALYEAKRRGGRAWRFYSSAHSGAAERKLGMDRMLRRAFDRGELTVHYQPLVEPATGRVSGAEALLRWPEPELGWVPPAVFVPIAEETGLMVRIGEWVLREACGQLRSWIDSDMPVVRMAVNVSRCQLEHGRLVGAVASALRDYRLPPELLELELSERGVLRRDPELEAQLQELKQLGVRLVVDDFGTGDASITYLRQFPLDGLKVDRSLVSGLQEGSGDAAITAAILAMAHQLKLGVVAEGVEKQSQLDWLAGFGCEQVQGFFFSAAVEPEAFRRMVLSRGSGLEAPAAAQGVTR